MQELQGISHCDGLMLPGREEGHSEPQIQAPTTRNTTQTRAFTKHATLTIEKTQAPPQEIDQRRQWQRQHRRTTGRAKNTVAEPDLNQTP